MLFKYSNHSIFISLLCFTAITCGNLSLNILKLFWHKEKKKTKKKRLSQKRSSCKVFCKMKYLFCKATKLDNLQIMEPLATIFA